MYTIQRQTFFDIKVTILKKVSHPNIVQMYSAYLVGDNRLWMVLEFMDAGSLAMQVFDRPYVLP